MAELTRACDGCQPVATHPGHSFRENFLKMPVATGNSSAQGGLTVKTSVSQGFGAPGAGWRPLSPG